MLQTVLLQLAVAVAFSWARSVLSADVHRGSLISCVAILLGQLGAVSVLQLQLQPKRFASSHHKTNELERLPHACTCIAIHIYEYATFEKSYIFMIGMHWPAFASAAAFAFAFAFARLSCPAAYGHTHAARPNKAANEPGSKQLTADSSSSLIKSQARPNSQATPHFRQLHAKLRWRCFS